MFLYYNICAKYSCNVICRSVQADRRSERLISDPRYAMNNDGPFPVLSVIMIIFEN